jgi:hypothetical protein
MKNCIECPNHKVINDPDPHDSFCRDDIAVVCIKTPNDDIKKDSAYLSDKNEFKCVTRSCRPYNKTKESECPDWCPISEKSKLKKKVNGFSDDPLKKLEQSKMNTLLAFYTVALIKENEEDKAQYLNSIQILKKLTPFQLNTNLSIFINNELTTMVL